MAEQKKISTEPLKWVAITSLAVAALFLHQYYLEQAWWVRLAIWLSWFLLTSLLVSQTVAGSRVWQLAKEAKLELHRIVWPTRHETIQTTIVVVIMVTITSLLLWSIDAVLLWIISFFTGQGV